MGAEEIHLSDWMRIWLGNVPAEFYIELVIRISYVYLLLLVAMRAMGKRMAATLNRYEIAALVSLAAGTGVIILAPDRGLLPALVVLIVIIAINRGISMLSFRSQRFEKATQGDVDILVEDGRLNIKTMEQVRITREGIYARLRTNGIKHLGNVKRLYIEAEGKFTLIQELQPKPGLCVIPEQDRELIQQMQRTDRIVCSKCGNEKKDSNVCDNCSNREWEPAIED